MKKLFLIPFLLLTMVSLVGCGDKEEIPELPVQPEQPTDPGDDDDTGNDPVTPEPGGNGRYLVLFCSRSGNTERVANQIQQSLDCDILEVEPQTPYDNDYNSMLARAQEELADIRSGNYPQVKTVLESFDDYETVFIGYPIWYGSMATPMQSFLHSHASKLAGKRIALFATSGSSGISTSVNEAKTLCPAATFTETLHLTSSSLSQMESRVTSWLQQLGAGRNESDGDDEASLNVRITVGSQSITATMTDNPTVRDFLSRLPLTVTLDDYAGEEKIFYPDPHLVTDGSPRGGATRVGDIKLFAPWGDVAIFYENGPDNSGLIPMGHIDEKYISVFRVSGSIPNVTFERL